MAAVAVGPTAPRCSTDRPGWVWGIRASGAGWVRTCAATSLYTSCGRSEGNRLTEAAPTLSRPRAA